MRFVKQIFKTNYWREDKKKLKLKNWSWQIVYGTSTALCRWQNFNELLLNLFGVFIRSFVWTRVFIFITSSDEKMPANKKSVASVD